MSVHKYWREPNKNKHKPEAYTKERQYKRSYYLLSKIQVLPHNFKILELGSGSGRNLSVLFNSGYENLTGIEISKEYIDYMRERYPELADNKIINGSIEETIPYLRDGEFDLIFSMAVLEHLPYQSDSIFYDVFRICKNYLITIEDEINESDRHFPRNYKTMFEEVGFKQLSALILTNKQGLSPNFVYRCFTKPRQVHSFLFDGKRFKCYRELDRLMG